MADLRDGLDEATLAVAARHALHDEELVAAFAVGGLEAGPDVDRARALIERCTACRDLHADVESIGAAIRMTASYTQQAPRDFRLTTDDARRLGGPVSARGILARLAAALAGVARPLGASMAALGLVGVLVGSMSLGSAAMPGSLAIDAAASSAAGIEQGPVDGPNASRRTTAQGVAATDDRDGGNEVPGPGTSFGTTAANPGGTLFVASVVLLIGGLVLLVIGTRRRSSGGR